jgi:HSP20 family molecular chaperone IbpA
MFAPEVDITETGKEIRVSAELPGLEKKDVEVDVTADTLTIRGEKKEEREEKEGVLRITLPKKPEAQPRRQKIEISG